MVPVVKPKKGEHELQCSGIRYGRDQSGKGIRCAQVDTRPLSEEVWYCKSHRKGQQTSAKG